MTRTALRVLFATATDSEIVCEYSAALGAEGHQIQRVGDGVSAQRVLADVPIDLLIADTALAGASGMELAAEVAARNLHTHVVLMTGLGTVEEAVLAMKLGVVDYLIKPVAEEDLLCIARMVAGSRQGPPAPSRRGQTTDLSFLIGESDAWRTVVDRVRVVGPTDSSVLVRGESGTGKEMIALALHACSPRHARPFVAVNCAALPASLLESELFGHQRGAFTGAVTTEKGRFELAHGGTLLLDEVDEIPLPLQVKLLRSLQEREIERLGRATPIAVDVRLVATTKVDLKELVELGGFRRDLYYRLSVVPVELPNLVERKTDIPLLVSHFLRVHSARLPRKPAGINIRAMELLTAYDYPGNVRELEHVVEAACALSSGDEIGVEHLPEDVRACRLPARLSCGTPIMKLEYAVSEFERGYLDQVVASFHGTRTELAAGLGLSRKGLWQKLKKHGI